MEHAIRRCAWAPSRSGQNVRAWQQTIGWVSVDQCQSVEWTTKATGTMVALRIHRLTLDAYRKTDTPANAVQTIEFQRFEIRALVAAGLKLLGPIEAIGALDDETEPQQVTT